MNLDESTGEVEDKRSGSPEGSAKAQLRCVINESVSENGHCAGCGTAANCCCFKSSCNSFVIFSCFLAGMQEVLIGTVHMWVLFRIILHWQVKKFVHKLPYMFYK